MGILTAGDYENIRVALDVSLTATALPDSVIAQPVYLGRAEAWVIAQIPDAASATGARLAHIKRAVSLYCASLLAPAVVRLTSLTTQTRDMAWSRATFDPEARAQALLAQAQEAVKLAQSTTSAPAVGMFRVAGGRRGVFNG